MCKRRSWKPRLFAALRNLNPSKSVLRPSSQYLNASEPQQPKAAQTISLLSLPNEILLMIAEVFEQPECIYRLIQTNRRLASLLTHLLHGFAMQDKQGMPALHWAAEKGHEGLVRLLLQKGVDVNLQDPGHRGWTALHLAAHRNHEPVVRLLLKMKADVSALDRFDQTALHRAVYRASNEAIVKLLLESGADVDAQDFMGQTALHLVIQRGSKTTTLLELLLDFRADVSLKNIVGETPIHEVAKTANIGLAMLLLRDGARAAINDVDSHGRTALHRAVSTCSKVFELLLQSGSDINIRDAHGSTALHTAIKEGCECNVRKLVEKGTDLTIKDNNGKTPRVLARELNRMDVTKWRYGDLATGIEENLVYSETHSSRLRCLMFW